MGIENTSQRPNEAHLVGIMEQGQSAYIEGMEAEGQRQLVASAVLPIDCNGDEDAILALGVTFGEPTDDLFREVTLPDGWEKRGTDHDMWSEVVDEQGVARIAVFYKAAFYDRRAFMRLA